MGPSREPPSENNWRTIHLSGTGKTTTRLEFLCTMTHFRDYSFLGTTQSLCPICLSLVPAKIITRGRRVYFRKRCPAHGERDDFVCSDVRFYDRHEFTVPAKQPREVGVLPDRGCPFDCGLCTEHEQHTCIGLVEITDACNLSCPMCYASSGPGKSHHSVADCSRAIDRLVEVEGRPEVLQLSGGEPTIHPQFLQILDYALAQPVDYVQINTNGLRLAHDPALVDRLAAHRSRLEVFFQLDGLNDRVTSRLRGEAITETKLRALELLGTAGVHVTLAATLQPGVNTDQCGPLVEFAAARPWITGINFQPATYSGRHFLPEQLEQRVTFPDVILAIAAQTNELFKPEDFMPLPCAHPNCHSISYAYRHGSTVVPLARLVDLHTHFDLLANGIAMTRPQAKALMNEYLGRLGCCGGHCSQEGSPLRNDESDHSGPPDARPLRAGPAERPSRGALRIVSDGRAGPPPDVHPLAATFFDRVLAEDLGAPDVFRITITSFLDAYNFDVRRLMKCCTHNILPSGHVIPFCAYNVLYREGHVRLPALRSVDAACPTSI